MRVVEKQAEGEVRPARHGPEHQQRAAQVHPEMGQAVEAQQFFVHEDLPFHLLRRKREGNVPGEGIKNRCSGNETKAALFWIRRSSAGEADYRCPSMWYYFRA